jgi:hypothetical protein
MGLGSDQVNDWNGLVIPKKKSNLTLRTSILTLRGGEHAVPSMKKLAYPKAESNPLLDDGAVESD